MIPSILNSDPHVTQNEIQNEIKTIETKKSTNNSLVSLRYSELLRQEKAKECKRNAEIIKVVNGNASVANVQVCGKLFTSTNVYKMEIGDANIRKEGLNSEGKKSMFYPTNFWVQFGALEAADEPMEYSPDMNSFVAKAFFITFIMFFCTTAFVCFVCYSEDLFLIFASKIGFILFLAGGFVMLVINYALECSACIRTFPYNYVMLIFAVGSYCTFSSYITAFFNILIIAYELIAVTVTAFVIFLLALTSFDFKNNILYVIVIGVASTVLIILLLSARAVQLFSMKPAHQAILFIATILNVVFLAVELQTTLSGKTLSVGEDEYAFASFFLFTSIIDVFVKIYKIIVCIYKREGFFTNRP